ncbi:MAG: hypothetical protein RIQ47_831 [Bacteroidota bacterium]|jgi:predicted DNA-binding protein (MmcQ/YjbR family)
MDVESLREYCLQKPLVTEEFPFDDVTLVFKVCGKMFLLTGLDNPEFSFNVKCDPELAIELREKHTCVRPGYHMNKAMWNTVIVDGSVSDNQLKRWIDHSYEEVIKRLPKKEQLRLKTV